MDSTLLQNNQSRMSILHAIVDIAASGNSIIEIFSRIRQELKQIIPCDYVTILFNNEDSRYFYVIPALNFTEEATQKELTIPYGETSITESLRTKATLIRDDLNMRGNLTPGDLIFLPQGVSSDISVPIVHQNRVRAILNLSSYKTQAFTREHQQLIEEVALLLSLAIDRVDLVSVADHESAQNKEWQARYKKLFRYSIIPIAIINAQHDIINDTNRALQKLTGYKRSELNGMQFSALHPQTNFTRLLSQVQEQKNGKPITVQNLKLRRKGGTEINVKARLVKINSQNAKANIIFYKVIKQRSKFQAAKQDIPQKQQMGFPKAPAHAATLEDTLHNFLSESSNLIGAKYVAIHRWNDDAKRLKMLTAQKLTASNGDELARPWLIGLNQGPFQAVFKSATVKTIEDVFKSKEFVEWTPIARKLGYRSIISLPLTYGSQKIGVLTYFAEEFRTFDTTSIELLQNYANYLALIIVNYETQQTLTETTKQFEYSNTITKTINLSQNLRDVVQATASAAFHLLHFDTCSITLFDNVEDRCEVHSFVSETVAKLFQLNKWEAIEGTQIGWIGQNSYQENLVKEADKFQSHLDLILIAREKYLGTISLSSLEPNCYREKDRQLFEHIADHFAFAVSQGYSESSVSSAINISSFSDASQANNRTENLDDALLRIVDSVADTVATDLCTLRFIDNGKALPGISGTLSEEKIKTLIEKEASEWIPVIIETGQPCIISEIKHSPNDKEKENRYHAYLGVPVIRHNTIIAIIGVYWHEPKMISKTEIEFVLIAANYAGLIIDNNKLQQALLQHSNGLKKTNTELENFVYTVSHDLKSPIVSIQGFTSILLNDFQSILNEESLHYIKRVQTNANQMEVLVKDLLELSRIGRVVSPFEKAGIDEVIRNVLQEQMYQIERKEIKVSVAENLPVVYCDKKRIHQVFANLLDNAIKYIGDDNPSPRIEIGHKDEDDRMLFYVKDNGIGIAKEYHQHIFGLFKGVMSSQGDDEYSTGVGLAIVKRIIEHHNGKIWLDSEPGNGSTFYFTIQKSE